MKQATKQPHNTKFRALTIILIAVVIFAAVTTVLISIISSPQSKNPEVITVSTLEKIVNVSELSTFTAVYNGIAKVMNEKDSNKVDYYVSYEARVDAGIDLENISITINHDTKTINVTLPDVYITDINVDITSLDFIFVNKKANTSTVTQTAFKQCESDVEAECEQENAIFDLAKQNAINILTALVKPIIEQMDSEYKLVVN